MWNETDAQKEENMEEAVTSEASTPTVPTADSPKPSPEAADRPRIHFELITDMLEPREEKAEPEHPPQLPAPPEPESESPKSEKPHFSFSFLRNRHLIRFFLCCLLIGAIVCFVVFGGARFIDRAARIVRYAGDDTEFAFDSHSSNRYLSFRDGLAVASISGLLCLNSDGEEIALIQNRMDAPVLQENGTAAMSYGVGGNTITAVHYKNGEILNLTVPGTLLDAALATDSGICYSSVQTGYKTVLAVWNSAGEEIYRWYSSTQFFSQCALSGKDSYLAAIALGQNGSSFEASCVIFETNQAEPIATISLGSDLIYELAFVDDRRLCAVGENALYYFDIDGTNLCQYSYYDSGELLFYNLHADGFSAIVQNVNEAGNRFRLTTVSNNGEQLAELALDDEILDISANGGYLAVLTADALRVYDSRLRLSLHSENIGFATHVCVQKDGAALLIDGATAHRVS